MAIDHEIIHSANHVAVEKCLNIQGRWATRSVSTPVKSMNLKLNEVIRLEKHHLVGFI